MVGRIVRVEDVEEIRTAGRTGGLRGKGRMGSPRRALCTLFFLLLCLFFLFFLWRGPVPKTLSTAHAGFGKFLCVVASAGAAAGFLFVTFVWVYIFLRDGRLEKRE